jgi:tetratricopeptide (TPR) repeat protein
LLEQSPNNYAVLLRRAALRNETGQIALAQSDVDRAIQIAPNFASCYGCRADIKVSLGKLNDAISDYTTAIQLAPKRQSAYRTRASAYYKLKAFDKAAADYTQTIQLAGQIDPTAANHRRMNAPTWSDYNGRGQCYLELKRYQKAIDDFTSVLKLRTGLPGALRLRARAYQALGKTAEAKKDLKEADSVTNDFAPFDSLGTP